MPLHSHLIIIHRIAYYLYCCEGEAACGDDGGGAGICTNTRLRIAKVSHPPTLERMLYSEHTYIIENILKKKKLKNIKINTNHREHLISSAHVQFYLRLNDESLDVRARRRLSGVHRMNLF